MHAISRFAICPTKCHFAICPTKLHMCRLQHQGVFAGVCTHMCVPTHVCKYVCIHGCACISAWPLFIMTTRVQKLWAVSAGENANLPITVNNGYTTDSFMAKDCSEHSCSFNYQYQSMHTNIRACIPTSKHAYQHYIMHTNIGACIPT